MNTYPNELSAAGESSARIRRAMILSSTVPRAAEQSDFEVQIHSLEIRAYVSVLQAFSAQSNVLTWEKEKLMSDLRKELRISDAEHRELLGKINSDETVKAIRNWRKSDSFQQPLLPESVSNKQRKTKITIASSPGYYPQQLSAPVQPSVALVPSRDEDYCADVSGTYYTRGNDEQLPVANSRKMHAYLGGRKPLASLEDGNVMMNREDIIEIFDTDMVIRKAEQIYQTETHDPSMMKKARHMLKVHEQSLLTAIEKLSDYTVGHPIQPGGYQNQAPSKWSGQAFHHLSGSYPRR